MFSANTILKQRGITVAEIVIAVFILTVAIIGFYQAAVFSFEILDESRNEVRAGCLAEEGIEAVRSIRNNVAWIDAADGKTGIGELNLAVNDTYYPIISGDNWELAIVNPGPIDGFFTRKMIFEKVSRDPVSGDIEAVYNSVNDDVNTRKIKSVVEWRAKSTVKNIVLITYITNF